MKKYGLRCPNCKVFLAPGEGCDTHGGIYCDPDSERKCPRCDAIMPPVSEKNYKDADWWKFGACKKCSQSSRLLGLKREFVELNLTIEKAQKRIDELSQ